MKRKCNSIEGWGSVAVGEREWRKVNIVIDAVVNCERWIYIYIYIKVMNGKIKSEELKWNGNINS